MALTALIDLDDSNQCKTLTIPRRNLITASAKRGDGLPIRLRFMRAGVAVALESGHVLTACVKLDGEFDANSISETTTWAAPGTLEDDFYEGYLGLNQVALDNALMRDGDTENDIPSVLCMLEFSWIEPSSPGGLPQSSNTIALTVNNDVKRGDEGISLDGPPPYPSAGAVGQVLGNMITERTDPLTGDRDVSASDIGKIVMMAGAEYYIDPYNVSYSGIVKGDRLAVQGPGNVVLDLFFTTLADGEILMLEIIDDNGLKAAITGHYSTLLKSDILQKTGSTAQTVNPVTTFTNGLTSIEPITIPAAVSDGQGVNLGQVVSVAGYAGTARKKDVTLAASATGTIEFSAADLGRTGFGLVRFYIYGHATAGGAAKRLYSYTCIFDYASSFSNLVGNLEILAGTGSTAAFTVNSVTASGGNLVFDITNDRSSSGTIYCVISEVR